MKEYTVEGFFPQAVAHAAEQLALVRANRFDIAAKRGLDQFRTRPGIKGKQIRTVKLTIQFVRTVPMEWIVKTHKPDTPLHDSTCCLFDVIEAPFAFEDAIVSTLPCAS